MINLLRNRKECDEIKNKTSVNSIYYRNKEYEPVHLNKDVIDQK
jgi:hypothetical protein